MVPCHVQIVLALTHVQLSAVSFWLKHLRLDPHSSCNILSSRNVPSKEVLASAASHELKWAPVKTNLSPGPAPSVREAAESDAVLLHYARLDRSNFAPIYRRYSADIYRYCLRCLASPEDAEDATSQVFIQAMARLNQLQNDNFRPWLFCIAHNVVIDILRRRKPVANIDSIDVDSGALASPESVALNAELRALLDSALSTLSDRDRQVVHLRLAGLSGQEIADALQCSHAAVRVAHHRAIERMRVFLTERATVHD